MQAFTQTADFLSSLTDISPHAPTRALVHMPQPRECDVLPLRDAERGELFFGGVATQAFMGVRLKMSSFVPTGTKKNAASAAAFPEGLSPWMMPLRAGMKDFPIIIHPLMCVNLTVVNVLAEMLLNPKALFGKPSECVLTKIDDACDEQGEYWTYVVRFKLKKRFLFKASEEKIHAQLTHMLDAINQRVLHILANCDSNRWSAHTSLSTLWHESLNIGRDFITQDGKMLCEREGMRLIKTYYTMTYDVRHFGPPEYIKQAILERILHSSHMYANCLGGLSHENPTAPLSELTQEGKSFEQLNLRVLKLHDACQHSFEVLESDQRASSSLEFAYLVHGRDLHLSRRRVEDKAKTLELLVRMILKRLTTREAERLFFMLVLDAFHHAGAPALRQTDDGAWTLEPSKLLKNTDQLHGLMDEIIAMCTDSLLREELRCRVPWLGALWCEVFEREDVAKRIASTHAQPAWMVSTWPLVQSEVMARHESSPERSRLLVAFVGAPKAYHTHFANSFRDRKAADVPPFLREQDLGVLVRQAPGHAPALWEVRLVYHIMEQFALAGKLEPRAELVPWLGQAISQLEVSELELLNEILQRVPDIELLKHLDRVLTHHPDAARRAALAREQQEIARELQGMDHAHRGGLNLSQGDEKAGGISVHHDDNA